MPPRARAHFPSYASIPAFIGSMVTIPKIFVTYLPLLSSPYLFAFCWIASLHSSSCYIFPPFPWDIGNDLKLRKFLSPLVYLLEIWKSKCFFSHYWSFSGKESVSKTHSWNMDFPTETRWSFASMVLLIQHDPSDYGLHMLLWAGLRTQLPWRPLFSMGKKYILHSKHLMQKHSIGTQGRHELPTLCTSFFSTQDQAQS